MEIFQQICDTFANIMIYEAAAAKEREKSLSQARKVGKKFQFQLKKESSWFLLLSHHCRRHAKFHTCFSNERKRAHYDWLSFSSSFFLSSHSILCVLNAVWRKERQKERERNSISNHLENFSTTAKSCHVSKLLSRFPKKKGKRSHKSSHNFSFQQWHIDVKNWKKKTLLSMTHTLNSHHWSVRYLAAREMLIWVLREGYLAWKFNWFEWHAYFSLRNTHLRLFFLWKKRGPLFLWTTTKKCLCQQSLLLILK